MVKNRIILLLLLASVNSFVVGCESRILVHFIPGKGCTYVQKRGDRVEDIFSLTVIGDHSQVTDGERAFQSALVKLSLQKDQIVEVNKCGVGSCPKIGDHRCMSCKQAFYCSVVCQLADWKKHKPTCHVSSK